MVLSQYYSYVCMPVASRDPTHDGKSETCEITSLDHKFV